MEKTVLQRTVDEYIESIQAKKKVTESTIKRKRQSFNYLIRVVGDVQPRNITETHIDKTFELMAKTRGENTMNVDLSNLRQFFKWCRRRKVTPASHDPVAEVEAWDLMPTERFILNVEEFPALLGAARTPRDRMVLALGLYLFLRASEICDLKIGHVDRARGFIYTDIKKTKIKDKMPISVELEAELKTWLAAYEEEVGVLRPDYYLVPSRSLDTSVYDHEADGFVRASEEVERLRPTDKIGRPSSIVRWTLKQIGYAGVNDGESDETDEAPKAIIARQGIHILRRSGARALFDYLRDHAGYDGALQRVRVMLHHSTARMTEKYLDVTVENTQRDEAIRGKLLFPHIAKPVTESHDNVVNLDDKRAG